MNQVQTTIGGGGGTTGGGGSTTTEISNLQNLVQQFQTIISSGSTSGIGPLLDAFLQQLSKLQGSTTEADSRNVIISLIGNIYTLQQSVQSGNADSASFQFFIKNIQDGLQKVSTLESGGSSSGGGGGGGSSGTSITNADISNVQSLFTQLQNILNSGSTQGSSAVLQQLITVLQGFTAKVSDSNALQILNSIIANITKLQQQAAAGSVDLNSFASLLVQSVNGLNQFIQVVNSINASGGASTGGASTGGSNGGWSWNVQTSPTVVVQRG